MGLEYLGKKYLVELISKEESQLETGLVWTNKIARVAKKLGFKTELFYYKNFNHENENIKYYNKYTKN